MSQIKKAKRVVQTGWHIDQGRGIPNYPFAICGPFRDGLPGTAVLGFCAYRPHAEVALAAIQEAEAAGKFP